MPMRVLVSGAGIAGPTLAFFLAKTGARITVVEKAKSLLPHGQNVDIQGSALTDLSKMNVMDQVRAANTTERGAQILDKRGHPVAVFPISEATSEKSRTKLSPTSQFEILRGDLAIILSGAAKDIPNVDYILDTTIKDVISNDEDAVRVELSDGSVQDYDLLVVADGQWSKVRKQCFSPESISINDLGMYAMYWTVPRLASDNDYWNLYPALHSRMVTTRPDPHGTYRTAFTYMPSTDIQKLEWKKASRSEKKVQQAFLKKTFADAGWQTKRLLDAMDEAPDFYFHAIQQIKMTKWSNNRVICLGDTAYAPTPLTGAGTSLAIIGGYVLAGELSKLKEGDHPAKALEAYEAKYRPFVEKKQKIPPFTPGIAHPATPFQRWLLLTFMWLLSKIVSIPWLSISHDEYDDEGFPLPIYSAFEDEVSK